MFSRDNEELGITVPDDIDTRAVVDDIGLIVDKLTTVASTLPSTTSLKDRLTIGAYIDNIKEDSDLLIDFLMSHKQNN